MIRKNILFCGAPLTGKTTLLYRLEQSKGSLFASISSNVEQKILSITVKNFDNLIFSNNTTKLYEINLITIPGHVFFEREEKFDFVVSQTNVIVYVISTENVGATPSLDLQREYFNYYTSSAKKFSKLWTQIPWIMVLSKIDLGTKFPEPFSDVPIELKNHIISVCSFSGYGIDSLWKEIFKVSLPNNVETKTFRKPRHIP